MNFLKHLVFSILITSTLVGTCYSQTSINTAGGEFSSGSGSYSQSIGQAFYSSKMGAQVSTSEGVQQPFEISVDTSILVIGINAPASFVEEGSLKVYPNPLSEDLFIESSIDKSYNLEIIDLQGKVLQSMKVNTRKHKISFENYPTGTYLVRIDDSKTNKSQIFKIIKTD